MNELIERFMMYLAAERGLSTAYQLSVRQTLEMLSRWLEEQKVSIADVQAETLQGFLASLQQSSHSRSSCRVMMVHVRIFFRWLQSRGFLAQDPAALLETPRPELRLPETMDEKIMAELIESVSPEEEPYGSRDRAILELLYGCGLRVSELISLRLDAYDAKEQFLRVTGKGDKTRFVPVGTAATQAINHYLSHTRPKLVRKRSYPQIFLSRLGRPLTRDRIRQIVRERADLAGIDQRVYPHLFRHSFATHLLHHEADLRIIQELLGHADISTTQIYTHVDESGLRSILKQFHPRG